MAIRDLETSSGLLGAIEGGGTKFVCAVATTPDSIVDLVTVPTRDPAATLEECCQALSGMQAKHGRITAIGFGCFGPLELRHGSPQYGHMLPTPKPHWSGVDLLQPLRSRFEVPVALDTDVGAAALGEWQMSSPRVGSLAYVTVGTGIGGGIAPASRRTALMHSEMGHLYVRRDSRDSIFGGVCPFHADCLEGLASGTSIRKRWGCDLGELPPDHPGRSIIGGYLGQIVAAIALIVAPERIIFGGGVMKNSGLLAHIRTAAGRVLNGYLPQLDDSALGHYISPPLLGDKSGITGALELAAEALAEATEGRGVDRAVQSRAEGLPQVST